MTVSQPAYGAPAAASRQEAAVLAAYPGATISAVQFGGDDRATAFTIDTAEGATRNVYVNPWTAKVTGDLDPDKLPSLSLIHI